MSDQVIVERNIAVAIRDGVTLATDVYRPAGDGPLPTLLYRIRGSRNASFITGMLMMNPLDAVARGYAVVIQEVRGRGGSQDWWHPFVHERADGADCLAWVLGQPWCDGRIGTYGSAYAGVCAIQLTADGHDAIKACVLSGTAANYFDGWIYTDGCFELGWNVYWAYLGAAESITRLAVGSEERQALYDGYSDAYINAPQYAARLPVRDHPLLDNGVSPQYQIWLDHPTYDDYWREIDAIARADQIKAPVLSIVGWHDNFLKAHMDLYRAMGERAAEPARSNRRLVVGPWEHANYVSPFSTSRTGDWELGPKAASGVAVTTALILDWMDRWVKGADAGGASGVRFYQYGENRWIEAEEWPPPHREQRWYLHSGGAANTRDGDGTLSPVAPAGAEPVDSYRYDPADPTPTVGGKTLMPTIMYAGIYDQGPVEDRPDVLCYTSPILLEPVAVNGKIKVELWVTTSAVDTDFTAKLVDVSPTGYCAPMADGIVRGRVHAPADGPDPLQPGKPHRFTIDLWDLAHTFEAGHRIRVDIASANFPRFDRNLNNGGPLDTGTLADAVVAVQHVLHDADHPSCLVLPVR